MIIIIRIIVSYSFHLPVEKICQILKYDFFENLQSSNGHKITDFFLFKINISELWQKTCLSKKYCFSFFCHFLIGSMQVEEFCKILYIFDLVKPKTDQ